jgi:actin-related protein
MTMTRKRWYDLNLRILTVANVVQDTMTEEQRMEEGRRMFQIFAARMFEQRVLTAYKEKVAAERQEKLIQELDEENMAAVQKKAKKAKDAQKKKEKAQQKKLALAEEKSKREAEKAAEEAALRAAEEKKAEEARLKAEEKRKKREAQKKAEEEERARKEAEKQRRLQEQRERQAEIERKAREAKERERKEKEELRQKEKGAREAKERETRERKEKQEKEKRELEAKAKAEKEAQDHQKRQEQTAQQAAPGVNNATQPKRPHQQISIPIPTGLYSGQSFVSPHVPVATPVVPKAPTPNRPSTTSQRDPTSVPQTPQFGKSQSTSPNPSTPQQSSPGPLGHPGKAQAQQPFLHHPQATSPIHAALKGPPTTFQPGPFPGMQPMGMNGFHPGMPMMAPGFSDRMHHNPMFPHQQPMGNQFRPVSGPNGLPMHPGMSSMPMQQGRGFPVQHAPPGFSQQLPNGPSMAPNFGGQKDAGTSQSHSRQQSASFEKPLFDNVTATQPIARPGPIGRPGSVVHGQRSTENSQPGQNEIDDLSNQLGSSALLDDSDDPMASVSGTRRASGAPGGMGRQPFSQHVPFPVDHSAFNNPLTTYNTWAGPQNPFGAPSVTGNNYMAGWGTTPIINYGAIGAGAGAHGPRPGQPRSVAVRQMLCTACKNLEGASPDGFHSINAIREQIERLNPPRDEPISEKELLDLCETEGNPNNGGGYFDVRQESDGRILIRFEPDVPSNHRTVGAPGDIGSPVVGSIGVSRFPGPPGIPTPSGF